MMPEFLPDDCLWHLRRSDGYMDLRMWEQAGAELEQVAPAYREHVLYQQLQLRLAMEQQNWRAAVAFARALRRAEPDQASHWVQLAYATRRMKGIEAAHSILREARKKFPNDAIIPFNLACYECQLGDRAGALRHLQEAVHLKPECREMALRDRDLEPLWEQLDS